MVDIIRFSISRVSLCIPGLAYFSRRFYGKLRECSGEMNKRICGSFSGALFNTKVGEGKREVIKLHLQIMSRSHLKHSAYSATARVFPRWSTSNYTSVLHYAVILVIVSPLCPALRSFSFSFSLLDRFIARFIAQWARNCRVKEMVLQAIKKKKKIFAAKRYEVRMHRYEGHSYFGTDDTCFEKKYSR